MHMNTQQLVNVQSFRPRCCFLETGKQKGMFLTQGLWVLGVNFTSFIVSLRSFQMTVTDTKFRTSFLSEC